MFSYQRQYLENIKYRNEYFSAYQGFYIFPFQMIAKILSILLKIKFYPRLFILLIM